MPATRVCDFCGTEIEPGTGTMFVQVNGTVTHFCSSKCERNAGLGREARDLEWTIAGREAKGPAAPEPADEPEAEADVDEPAEERAEPADEPEAEEDVDEPADGEAPTEAATATQPDEEETDETAEPADAADAEPAADASDEAEDAPEEPDEEPAE